VSGELFLDTLIVADEGGVYSVPDTAETDPNAGGIRIFLDSARADAVKTAIACTVSSDGTTTLDRAYAKARFPWIVDGTALRFTAGKAPLSWGKGFLFNAGDPIFGAVPAVSSLTASEYRTAADWMGTVYMPLGGFSFAELAYLAPVESRHNRAGTRLVLAPSWRFLQSVEISYLFEEGPAQTASVSADGSLWADWYAAGSATRKTLSPDTEDFLSGINWTVSAGAFRMFGPFFGISVSARAEALFYPEEGRQVWYPSVQAGYDVFTLNLQALFATGNTLGTIESGSGAVPAVTSLPWVDSGSGLFACGISYRPLKEITLSVTAVRQLEKGDLVDPETTVGFGLVVSF
jgi:hypothetical protein